MAAEVDLDCRGMLCPAPIIELARIFGSVPVGGLVALAADDAAARVDIPAWCRMRDQEYAGQTVATDGVPVFWIRRLS